MAAANPRDRIAFDRASVRTVDVDGRLHVAVTPISKACVNPYRGSEIPETDAYALDPNKIYYLFRDPAELEKAADTFNNIPLLSSHEPVSAEDHKPDLVVGSTGTDAEFKAPYLLNSLVVWSAEAIKAIKSGDQKELSSAYRFVPVWEPGEYEGQKYDGVMKNIIGNHVALVSKGRAGSDVVVQDADIADDITSFVCDESWEEGKHPRDNSGKFGSGGGSSGKPTGTLKDLQAILEKSPHDKLMAALNNPKTDPKVKKHIEKELDSRADRGTSKGHGEKDAPPASPAPSESKHEGGSILDTINASNARAAALKADPKFKKELAAPVTRQQSPAKGSALEQYRRSMAPKHRHDPELTRAFIPNTPKPAHDSQKTEVRTMPKTASQMKASWAKGAVTALKAKLAADASVDDLISLLDDPEKCPDLPDNDLGKDEVAPPPVDKDDGVLVKVRALLAELAKLVNSPEATTQAEEPIEDDINQLPPKYDTEKKPDDTVDADKDKDKPAVTKTTMDAALKAHGEAVEKATIARINAIHAAREEVKPIVGNLAVVCDSAEVVYGAALKVLGVDTTGIDGLPALKALVKAHAPRRVGHTAPIAHDAKPVDDFDKMYPGFALIKTY